MPPWPALAYAWTAPNTALGLLLALLCRATGGRVAVVGGVIEAGGGLRWLLRQAWAGGGGASAMTLGHVVIAVDTATLDRSRVHERVHVRQYERWGPLFIPAYFVAALAARIRGGCPYFDNRFEREAYSASHPDRFG
ncbi:MAG: hypothetical protein AAF333_02745 [Planctomycetota bacterium]